jgi:hypothetical protein
MIVQMHKQKIIPKQQLGLSIQYKRLFFGGIPRNYKLKTIMKQQLDKKLLNVHGWFYYCIHLNIGNEISFDFVDNKYKVLFNYDGSYMPNSITVPQEVMNALEKKYFLTHYRTNKCYKRTLIRKEVDSLSDEGERIFCERGLINTLPEFLYLGISFNAAITIWNLSISF